MRRRLTRRGFLCSAAAAALTAGGGVPALAQGTRDDENAKSEEGERSMKKEIEGLRWRPKWVSHLGCIKGCLEHLGADVSWPWLYGGTGHAFVLNIHKVLCPSGPTAWNCRPLLFEFPPNLGYSLVGIHGGNGEPDFAAKQKAAWAFVRGCVDLGIPCYGWELDIPEYYVVHGCDDVGYYYSGPGCDEGKGPKAWQELADTDIGVLDIYSVQAAQPATDEKTVKDALSYAVKHAENRPEWTFPDYGAGQKGYAMWADALEQGTADGFGQGYNGAVWAECRAYAVSFLEEAKQRLAGKADALFDQAAAHYSAVRGKLAALAELYPFQDEAEGQLKSAEGAQLVREAAAAEEQGLQALAGIAEAI